MPEPVRARKQPLEALRPLLEAVDAERDRLVIAHYGSDRARRIRHERKHSGQIEVVVSLRAAVQAAVDENSWDTLEKLAPLIKAESKRLATMSVPRNLKLVRDRDG